MPEVTLELGLLYYLALGAMFAVVFVGYLVNHLDVRARHSSLTFRLLLLPAAGLLWPLVLPMTLVKLINLKRQARNRRAKTQQ